LLNQLTDYLRQKIQISDWQFENQQLFFD